MSTPLSSSSIHPTFTLPNTTGRRAWMLGLLACSLPLWSGCNRRKSTAQALLPGSTVLALGDSLTSGVGAAPGNDYPTALADLTGWEMINGGVSGNTSEQGLERLPALLQTHQPQLVLVGLGGNDFLRRVDSAQTITALRNIIQTCRDAGAQVILIAIPQPSVLAAAGVKPSDHPLYSTLASEMEIPLIEESWGEILGDPTLRSDAVHANAEGYAQFAQALAKELRELGFLGQ